MADRHENEEQSLTLGIAGFRYEDLSRPEGLKRLHDTFVAELAETSAGLHREYRDYLSCRGEGMTPVAVSDLLVRLAPRVGEFVARLFDVSAERERQRAAIQRELDSVFVFRNAIVGELAKHFKGVDARAWNAAAVQSELELLIHYGFPDLAADPDQERRIAAAAARLWRWANAPQDDAANARQAAVRELRDRLGAGGRAAVAFVAALKGTDDELIAALLEVIRRWSHLARVDPDLARTVANWVSFKEPEKTHFDALVPHEIETREGYGVWKGHARSRRRRDGFALTDQRHDLRHVLYEIDYCMYCHERDKDSCSKGMRNRKDWHATRSIRSASSITGCPLEEKISEMHLRQTAGRHDRRARSDRRSTIRCARAPGIASATTA